MRLPGPPSSADPFAELAGLGSRAPPSDQSAWPQAWGGAMGTEELGQIEDYDEIDWLS